MEGLIALLCRPGLKCLYLQSETQHVFFYEKLLILLLLTKDALKNTCSSDIGVSPGVHPFGRDMHGFNVPATKQRGLEVALEQELSSRLKSRVTSCSLNLA